MRRINIITVQLANFTARVADLGSNYTLLVPNNAAISAVSTGSAAALAVVQNPSLLQQVSCRDTVHSSSRSVIYQAVEKCSLGIPNLRILHALCPSKELRLARSCMPGTMGLHLDMDPLPPP